MAQVMEHIEYLSREIGARPAGTEEERQAALYITDQLQRETGFTTSIEEISSSSNLDGVRALCGIVTIVAVLLAILLPPFGVPALVLTILSAAVYILEALDRSLIPRQLARGASQNVVCKYQPNPEAANQRRARKIVLVAHYDTGKVVPPIVNKVETLGVPWGLVCMGAMALSAVFMLLRVVLFANAVGVGALIFNILTILLLLVVALPVAKAVMLRLAPYNEGANDNATGVAAIMEVARRISRGSVAEVRGEGEIEGAVAPAVRRRGARALRESGYLPEGAELVYEATQDEPPLPPAFEPTTDSERLAAAKAALAAFTGGASRVRYEPTDVASKLVTRAAPAEVNPAFSQTGEGFAYEGALDTPVPHMVSSADWQGEGAPATEALPLVVDADSQGEGAPGAPEPPARPAVAEDGPQAEEPAGAGLQGANAPGAPVSSTDSGSDGIGGGELGLSFRPRAVAGSEGIGEGPRGNEMRGASGPVAETPAEPEGAMGYENAPSWFVAAQRKAKRQDTGVVQPSQKSRFASSIAAAEAEIEERARAQREAAEAAERARRDAALAEQVAAMRAEREAAERADAEAAEAAASAASMETAGETAAEPASEAAVPAAPAAPAQPLAAWETWEPPADFVEPETLPAPKLDPVQPAKQRSMLLPSLSGTITFEGRGAGAPETTSPSRSGIIRRMRADIPSLSGVIRMQNGEAAEDDVASVATVGAEAAEAVAAAPVPAEAAEAVEAAPAAENEVPATPLSRTAAPAREPARESARTARAARREPSYEDVPKSRAGRLFGRFHRKGKGADLEETPQQWLDVEDDFNPQEAGRERGGWESFRASDYDQLEPPAPSPSRGGYDDYVAPGDDEYADYDDYDKYGEYDDYDEAPRGGRRWNGGAFSRVRLGRVNMRSGSEDEPEPEPVPEFADPSLSGEIGEAAELEQVYHFRNPKFTTEVWFVAVGSELDRHDGIRAFVEHHRADLRGALLVDVEALGAGRLTAVTEEGLFRPVVASSRAKRLLKKASAASAIAPEQAPLPNFESTASVAGREGLQVLHLAGVEATRPALLGSRNDTVEAVDEDLLMENIDYLTALVQRF